MSQNFNKVPVVSVLMTAYNREKYIGEAIESVLSSTFTDFELLIVDDSSKDKTVEIAESYAEKDSRVKVFVNERNLGDYPNRNRAASYASGKYIKYVDSDDLIYPWGLQILVTCMEMFPDAGLGICSLPQHQSKPFPFKLMPSEAYRYHYSHGELFYRAPLSSIINREVFEKEKGFKPIRMAGDFEMWHRLCKRSPVVLMPQGMVWYRKHGEQEMNDHSEYILVYEKIKISNLKSSDVPLSSVDLFQIIKREKRKLYLGLFKSLLKGDLNGFKLKKDNLKLWSES